MAITLRRLKSGKPRYLVRVRDELGNYYPSKIFKTIRDAEQYERKLKDRKDQKGLALSTFQKNLEVHQYIDEWLESRKHSVSQGWHERMSGLLHKYALPWIGGKKILDIKPPHVGKILSEMKDTGLKEQTRLHVFNILNKAFKDAVEYFGYLDRSPVLKQDRPKVHQVERNYLKPEESYKLLDYSRDHYLGPAVWLSILGGLRTSEIQALQWRNVDFDQGQILICAAYKRAPKKIEPFPKQRDWLIVPMPGVLSNYLLTQKKRFPLGFVAPAYMGGMLEQKKFYNGLKQLCKGAFVKSISPHELRHSCTEIWFRHGATLEDVRRLLGHKSTETTRRYVHRTDDRLIKLAKEIDIDFR